MSFSLDVFAGVLPDDITRSWVAGLAGHGLIVEPHPRFDFRRWRGGWAPFGLSAQLPKFPSHPVAAGFELDSGGPGEARELAEHAPDTIREELEQAAGVFHFGTASARTVADLRLQSVGAAVLADISRAAVYDPQRGVYFSGAEALQNALREAESFESSAEPASWHLEKFGGWGGAG